MKSDVMSFGSAVLDVFIKSPDLKVMQTNEVFTGEALVIPYGAKCEVEELVVCSGGGGTNTAVGFARLGLKTAVVARCGWDFAGRLVRQELKKEKVNDSFLVQVEGEKTDYSTILVGPDGGRTILVYRGGTKLEREVIDFKKLNAFWFYVAGLEGNLELLVDLVAQAKKKHIKVAVNPGRRELDRREAFLKIVKDVDVLIVNREEAARLLGLTIADEEVFKKACALLPQVLVVVTNGARGAHVCIPSPIPSFLSLVDSSKKRGILVTDGFKVKKADSTGAGDGFGSGLVTGLIKGWKLEKALKLGVSNGAAAVEKIGAKPGLIKESEIDYWLEKKLAYHWEK